MLTVNLQFSNILLHNNQSIWGHGRYKAGYYQGKQKLQYIFFIDELNYDIFFYKTFKIVNQSVSVKNGIFTLHYYNIPMPLCGRT